MALLPTAQSCLPFLGVPPLPPAAHVHPPGTGGGSGLQPIPTWPHQLPQQLGSGISPLATLHCAPGPRLQECHSRGHKGPLSEQRQGVGAQPSISSRGWGEPQLRARGWAAADSSMAPQLPPRHSGLQGLSGRKALILLVSPAPAASCSHCWLRKQNQHQYRMKITPVKPQHLCQRMLRAQPPQEGSRRAGTWGRGQEHQPAAAGFSLFQQLPSQCQQQGMCIGWGFPSPGHRALNNLFIALTSLLSRNGLFSSCTGPGAWVPSLSPPPAPSGIPAR